MDWLLLQLSDSAFPAGGFAHSAGLEAAWQNGEIKNAHELQEFFNTTLWQNGRASLPLLNAAFNAPESLPEFDSLCDAFLCNHVSNRASRLQGRAFVSACERCFPIPAVIELRENVREQRLCCHHSPLFGATLRAMNVALDQAQELFLFTALRGVVSAAVRLNIVGPHQAQQMQFASYESLNRVLSDCATLTVEGLAQPAPLLDLFQSTHDRLYSRLFQS
jgi:urease accessory protein